MSDPLLMALLELQEALAHAQAMAASVQRMLLVGASEEATECQHPADARADVSTPGCRGFLCRACGQIVEDSADGEASTA